MSRKPDTNLDIRVDPHPDGDRRRAGEGGYTLVALLALMSILALALSAAAPRIRQQVQRSLEIEAIARGQEVAEAIDAYRLANNGALPTSLEQLTDGIQPPGRIKKVQILRASAARDPLSKSGEWKVVRRNDPVWREFEAGLQNYVGAQIRLVDLARAPAYIPNIDNITNVLNVKSEKGDCEEDTEPNGTGPFIGVVSRSRCSSVVTFYGIDRHDRWVFTPVFR